MTTSELEYPVIALYKKDSMNVCVDEDLLTTATSHELKIGWYNDATLVDSNGKAVKVKSARFISGKGRFWGFTIFLDRIIKVELILDDKVSDMPFDVLKRRILSFQRRWGQAMDPEYAKEVLQELSEAQSIRELLELFLPQADKRRTL